MAHGEQGADGARGARGRQQVPDHGLDRADRAGNAAEAGLRPQRFQAGQLRAVARRRARTVAFDVVHLARRPVRRLVGSEHGPQLALAVRRQQVAAQVVGKPGRADQPQHGVPVGERVLEAFQQQQPGAFADHEPVGAAVERGAAAGRGERPQLAEPDLGEERIRPGHAAGHDRVCASRAQLVAGELDRVERRGAGGVQGEARPSQAEGPRHQRRGQSGHARGGLAAEQRPHVREPTGARTGHGLRQQRLEELAGEGGCRLGRQDDRRQDDARAVAVQARRAVAEQEVPRGLQHHVVQGVEGFGRRRLEVEPGGVEPELGQQAAAVAVGAVRLGLGPDHERGRGGPARVSDRRGCVVKGERVGPERVHVERAGEKPRDPDHRDGAVPGHRRPPRARMALAGMRPVAAAETMLPATPGPSPATKRPGMRVSSVSPVSIWTAKNLISGA